MADIYVRSTDGNNADSGATWALAKADLTGAAAIDAAGDRIFVSDNHAESTAGALTFALAGTFAAPVKVLCVDDAAEPPTALATTGTITTTGANSIIFTGYGYVYGLTFEIGTGASAAHFTMCSGYSAVSQIFESCNFRLNTTDNNARINTGSGGAGSEHGACINCGFLFSAQTQKLAIETPQFVIRGGSILSGSHASLTTFCEVSNGKSVLIEGFDFTHLPAAGNIFQINSGIGIARNCRLPASWTGAAGTTPTAMGGERRAELWNCDSGDTVYRMRILDALGTARDETTIVRTGGASDGDTALSWLVVSDADAEFSQFAFRCPEIYSERITSGLGASKTATLEILHFASAALTDAEVWAEVQYMGTSGAPLALIADDAVADILATAANQATSAESWDSLAAAYSAATNYVVGDIVRPTVANGAVYRLETDAGTTAAEPTWGTTDGGTTVDATGRTWRRCTRQKCAVTFTPQEKGVAIVTVCVAKASQTLYVCPKVTVA